MYLALVTLERIAADALKQAASTQGVIFSHYESLDGNVKLLMADDEKALRLVINESLDFMEIPMQVTRLVEGHTFHITL